MLLSATLALNVCADTLLPYRYPQIPCEVHAARLATRLDINRIAGLMPYSSQNIFPMPKGTYNGV